MRRSIKALLCFLLVFCTLNFIPFAVAHAQDLLSAGIKGDVNDDGKIMTEDARLALSDTVGLVALSDEELDRADMNSDGVIDTADVINILRGSADLSVESFQPITHKTPYTIDSSSQRVQYCETIVDYAETFATNVEGDRSNPLYTPLMKGTYDRVTKTDDEFVYLASGRKTYKDAVKVFSGYQLSNSTVTHKDIVDYRDDSTDLYFALDWKVPFTVTLGPQSYETGTLRYLIKPINPAKFYEAMDVALASAEKLGKRLIKLKTENGVESINASHIMCSEAHDHYQYVVLLDGTCIKIRMTVTELFAILSKHGGFIRVGSPYIINLRYVKNVSRTDVLLYNDIDIRIPRGKYADIKNAFWDYQYEGQED